MSQEGINGSSPEPGDNATPFERFEQLARRIVNVPKAEIDKKREQEKRRKAKKRAAA
jgi:hypothetical protein